MNSHIARLSLYSFLIFFLVIVHLEQDDAKQIVYASNNHYSYDTENDINDGNDADNSSSEIKYVTNVTQGNTELDNEYSANTTTEKNEVKNIFEPNDVTINNNTLAYNENQQALYGKAESGPNNNDQFEEDNSNIIESNNAVVTDNTNSNTGNDPEVEIAKNLAEIGQQFARAPEPPGGGGEDPFAVPFDDFYGISIVLGASILFGIARMRKLKSLKSIY